MEYAEASFYRNSTNSVSGMAASSKGDTARVTIPALLEVNNKLISDLTKAVGELEARLIPITSNRIQSGAEKSAEKPIAVGVAGYIMEQKEQLIDLLNVVNRIHQGILL